jgi:hypothetical protein
LNHLTVPWAMPVSPSVWTEPCLLYGPRRFSLVSSAASPDRKKRPPDHKSAGVDQRAWNCKRNSPQSTRHARLCRAWSRIPALEGISGSRQPDSTWQSWNRPAGPGLPVVGARARVPWTPPRSRPRGREQSAQAKFIAKITRDGELSRRQRRDELLQTLQQVGFGRPTSLRDPGCAGSFLLYDGPGGGQPVAKPHKTRVVDIAGG